MSALLSLPRYAWPFLCFVAFGLTSCSKREADQPPSAPPKPIDACKLLTNSEIEAIQGAAVKDAKSTSKIEGGIIVSECYFALSRSADSIALTVLRPSNNTKARGPRQVWNETFHRVYEKKIGRDGKVKEPPHPVKIDGLGDEAFWTGLQFGGTLHVLKGETNIRISVGGPSQDDNHVERLKSLAEIVLQRLNP